MADVQRQRVYNAESVLDKRARLFRSKDKAQTFIDKVMASDLWSKELRGPKKVSFRIKRSNSTHSHAIGNEIALDQNQVNDHIILHELAHVVTFDGHGPKYCAAYLSLVEKFMGKIAARNLRESFIEHEVEFTSGQRAKNYSQAVSSAKRKDRDRARKKQEALNFCNLIGYQP